MTQKRITLFGTKISQALFYLFFFFFWWFVGELVKFIVLSLISLKLGPVGEEAQLKIRFTMSDRPWRVRRNGLVRPFRQMEKRGEVKNKNMSTKEIFMNDIDINMISIKVCKTIFFSDVHAMIWTLWTNTFVLTLIQMLQAIYFHHLQFQTLRLFQFVHQPNRWHFDGPLHHPTERSSGGIGGFRAAEVAFNTAGGRHRNYDQRRRCGWELISLDLHIYI